MVVLLPQHHESRMVIQPSDLILSPALEVSMSRRVLLRPAPSQAASEAARSLLGKLKIEPGMDDASTRQRRSIRVRQEPLIHEIRRIEQPGIEGKAGWRAVRRSRAIRGSQGQHLPHRNAMPCQRLDPLPRRSAQTSTGGAPGQCGRMQKHADPAARLQAGGLRLRHH